FGGGFGAGAVQGGDVAVAVEISLAEAATGKSVEVDYESVERCERCHGNRAEPGTPIEQCPRCGGSGQLQSMARTAFGQMVRTQACDTCGGTGDRIEKSCTECAGRGVRAQRKTLSVDIPAGIADEQRIRVTGRGHAGERGGPEGDLYVLVRVAEDARFIRDGNDLVSVVDVPAPAAALGTTLSVPTLDGDQDIEVAAGTQPGEVKVLRGQGMPDVRRGRRGDHRVIVNVVIPRKLSRLQRDALEAFQATLTEENLAEAREEGLFAKVRRALR
ncbi:MAG: molecular chaperone DnaJ, partial [Thermoleophilaceae bacterium]|nr:molecular chaperone DnaJ [Thermoleophilaceae bacterium]